MQNCNTDNMFIIFQMQFINCMWCAMCVSACMWRININLNASYANLYKWYLHVLCYALTILYIYILCVLQKKRLWVGFCCCCCGFVCSLQMFNAWPIHVYRFLLRNANSNSYNNPVRINIGPKILHYKFVDCAKYICIYRYM